MPDESVPVTIYLLPEHIARLTAIADPASGLHGVLYELIDHAQQGVYRPGSWERGWLCQVFGEDWLQRLEPDDDPASLSADGRVIFDRPQRAGTDAT